MKRKDAIRLFFRSILTSKFGAVDTDNGTLYFDGEEIQIGTEVKVEDTSNEENIDYIPAPDGDYKAGETTFTVKDSIVTAIDKPEESAEETVETEMEGAEGEVDEAAAMVTEVADEEKEPFDAEEAYKAIMITVAVLTGRVDALQGSVESLLSQPGAEPAFTQYSRANKNNKKENKSLFKVNR